MTEPLADQQTGKLSDELRVGDRVRCVNDHCADPVKAGRLKHGEIYTVSAVQHGWSLYLREMPSLQFNAERFERVTPS